MRDTLPASTRVGRVALTATDVDELAAFYRDVVGLAVISRTADRATLGAGDTPLLELREDASAQPRPASAAGLFHTAFRVPDRGALGDALDRVHDRWRLTGASDHRVSEALYLRDPEGNGVEIYRDRPRDEWPTTDGRVEMTTAPLDLDALAADAAGADAAPDGTDVGHVHLEVTDLDESREFYVDALGLQLRQQMGNEALFVAAGDYHHHVGLNTWNHRSAPADGRGLDWFELTTTPTGLDAAVDRLEAAGYAIEETENGATVRDPDGIEVRLRFED